LFCLFELRYCRCHLRTAGLQKGVEKVQSVEYPTLERQQVTMMALDFGEAAPLPAASLVPEKAAVLDAPNVVDVLVTGLHDLRLSSKGPGAQAGIHGLVLQAS
jgi:hypothetical protein